ncbi:hypothetical protein YC2023_116142 [Brassica napus]
MLTNNLNMYTDFLSKITCRLTEWKVLARGPGPLGIDLGRVWTGDFMSCKKAGLAGEAFRGTGPKAGKPIVICGFLHRDRVKGDVVATSAVERNRAPTAVRSPDTASAHYFVFQLQSAAEELKRQGSDKVDSSSSMCLPFFPMSFQTPQIGHACTELLDKKTNKIRGSDLA